MGIAVSQFSFIMMLATSLLLLGCDGAITSYVKGAKPDLPVPPLPPVVSHGPVTLKISPGAVKATSTNAAMTANITTTNHAMTSGTVSATVGISRSRTSF